MPEPRHDVASEVFPIPDVIPVFPLPNAVLFPATCLSLHIFEPRYLDMVADARKTDACIGMALLKTGWERENNGPPPVFPLGCVGRITAVTPLRDGRINLTLQGLDRYTIEEEVGGSRYRKAKVAVHACEPFQTIADDAVRATVTALAVRYLTTRQATAICPLIDNDTIPDAVLVNTLSSCLDFTPLEKLFLLESDSLYRQARRVIELLRFTLGGMLPSHAPGRLYRKPENDG